VFALPLFVAWRTRTGGLLSYFSSFCFVFL
jgi:hypothetical protein